MTTTTTRSPARPAWGAATAFVALHAAANIAIRAFGPAAVIPVGFLAIGGDLTLRDRLHDAWHTRPGLDWRLWARLLALVTLGAGISYAANLDAGALRIAIASATAFAGAFLADAITYHALRSRPWLERANLSNVPGALVDSFLFIPLAFGVAIWPLMLAQLAAKILGGAAWSLILRPR